jgi:hypothetical protein
MPKVALSRSWMFPVVRPTTRFSVGLIQISARYNHFLVTSSYRIANALLDWSRWSSYPTWTVKLGHSDHVSVTVFFLELVFTSFNPPIGTVHGMPCT